jgi:hypothetical protein
MFTIFTDHKPLLTYALSMQGLWPVDSKAGEEYVLSAEKTSDIRHTSSYTIGITPIVNFG